ncbi:protein-serine/threonine phosphatase, PP2C family [Skeletonema marinoi]|uniref:Protein-serine/threonine phosphatase, PP2C family n=1 Tax=Skeletonema marinoi TaxID=267567 RepID=A0AAD8YKD5_9STRA|nr:protein-serine/threonine phosphatase, PP2C family [Skeletonema marinoi]
MTKDTPTKNQQDHSINNDDDDDEFRSHSFRERRLTYSRHHILSDTAAAAVAELLAEGNSGDDFSDSDEDHAAVAAAAAAAACANDDSSTSGNKNNEEEATKVSAVKGGVEILTIPTKPAASPSSGNNNKRHRRGSSFSTTSDVSKPSFYLPSRILHAGEIVRRYSNNEQLKHLQQGGDDVATLTNTVATAQQQQQAHDVRTGAYSHPTHHATAKYIHNHHQTHQHQQNHLSTPHRNKWRQRFSFCSTTPDHILPFPRHVVGTFSCHGMEPVYDSDYDNSDDDDDSDAELDNNNGGATSTAINNTSIAKINQDRGGIIYPYANSHNMALFAVYDGHGEGGELVSQFALGEVSRILGGRLVDGFKMLEKKKKKKKQQQQCSDGDRVKKRRRGMMLESVQEETAAATGDDENDNDGDDAANEQAKDEHNANDDADEEFNIIEQSLKETFITVDRGLLDEEEIEPMYSGTTACVVLKRHQKLYVANSGDSRAVLARRTSSGGDSQKDGEEQNNAQSFTTIPLSIDQNPDSPGEKERILDSGGYVSPPPEPGLTARVWLDPNMTQIGLAMARSIGDHAVKGVGVIAEPVVSVHTIDEELDEFVIIATDGVWEFISSEDAVDIVGRCLYGTDGEKQDASEACEALIKAATAKWHEFEGNYRDDITAMVIRLKDLWSVV